MRELGRTSAEGLWHVSVLAVAKKSVILSLDMQPYGCLT